MGVCIGGPAACKARSQRSRRLALAGQPARPPAPPTQTCSIMVSPPLKARGSGVRESTNAKGPWGASV